MLHCAWLAKLYIPGSQATHGLLGDTRPWPAGQAAAANVAVAAKQSRSQPITKAHPKSSHPIQELESRYHPTLRCARTTALGNSRVKGRGQAGWRGEREGVDVRIEHRCAALFAGCKRAATIVRNTTTGSVVRYCTYYM